MSKRLNVEWFENNDLGIGMYIIPTVNRELWFNFNDLCDSLEIQNQNKRKFILNRIDSYNKDKVVFTRENGRDSEESFVSTAGVILTLNEYGQDVYAMLERKYNVENFMYGILNEYDKLDQNKEENVTLGDKFLLGSLHCDAKLSNKANDNLINLLKKNNVIDSILKHQSKLRTDIKPEEADLITEMEDLLNFCNDLEKSNNLINEFINEKINIKPEDIITQIKFNNDDNKPSILIDDFID